MKRMLPFILITSLNCSAADTAVCPSIADIKADIFKGWQAHDVDNDEPADAIAVEKFKQKVSEFYLAEWSVDYNGSGHCYYQGDLQILLAKDTPKPTPDHWKNLGSLMRCISNNVDICKFE